MHNTRRHRRRKGVILIVVLAMLTLITIVGLSFVAYSEKPAEASEHWRTVSWAAPVVERDLIEAVAGDLDFSASHRAIDAMAHSAADLHDTLCGQLDQVQDPKERLRLERLCLLLDALEQAIQRLNWLIRQMELSPPQVAGG